MKSPRKNILITHIKSPWRPCLRETEKSTAELLPIELVRPMRYIPLIFALLALNGCHTKQNKAAGNPYNNVGGVAPGRTEEAFARRIDNAINRDQLPELFQPADGVDLFEAWMLGWAYSQEAFGPCSDFSLPERIGNAWVSRVYVGREGRDAPSISIDAKNGRLICASHLTIDDPVKFVIQFYSQIPKSDQKDGKKFIKEKVKPSNMLAPKPTTPGPEVDAVVAPDTNVKHQ